MKIKLITAVLAFAANTAFAGTITNGDFSTGDLTGWSKNNGTVSVVNEGTDFVASLFAGLGKNVYTTLSQTLHLDAGDVLSGEAKFLAHDELPYNDNAFVSINGINLFSSNVARVGNYDTSPWTSFTFTALTSGNYVLEAGVENRRDNRGPSELRVDDFAVATVPEPTTIALLGLGLLGFAASRRKSAKSKNA
jgi:hypothetical protein